MFLDFDYEQKVTYYYLLLPMAMRKRSGSGAKRQHKCKLVPIYESFFKGEDLTLAHPNFWNELFLIKPMVYTFQ